MKPIRKAVFPVAGLGTRFLPATKAMPKEMLPVVDRPLIQHVVDEAREAGNRKYRLANRGHGREIPESGVLRTAGAALSAKSPGISRKRNADEGGYGPGRAMMPQPGRVNFPVARPALARNSPPIGGRAGSVKRPETIAALNRG